MYVIVVLTWEGTFRNGQVGIRHLESTAQPHDTFVCLHEGSARVPNPTPNISFIFSKAINAYSICWFLSLQHNPQFSTFDLVILRTKHKQISSDNLKQIFQLIFKMLFTINIKLSTNVSFGCYIYTYDYL